MNFYFQALNDLRSGRQPGSLIPWVDLRLYAETYGLDIEKFGEFVTYIRAMENALNETSEVQKEPVEEEPEQPQGKRSLKEAQREG